MALKKTKEADIRAKTRRMFEISLIISLLIVTAAFKFFPDIERETIIISASDEIVKLEDVDQTRQETRPPPPPRPPIPFEAPDASPFDDIDITSEIDLGEQRPAPQAPPPSRKQEVDEDDTYFEVVEDQPEIIGGLEAVRRNLVYPELAIRAGIEGTVTVLAYVNREGVVTHTEVLRGIGGGCDEAAMDAVRKVSFKPGMQRGKPVNVKVSVPVRFRLN